MLWFSVALAIVTAVYALERRSVWWLLASAAFYAPFALLLGLTPRFRYGPLLLIFYLLAGIALRISRHRRAWIFLIPIALFTVYMGVLVVIQ